MARRVFMRMSALRLRLLIVVGAVSTVAAFGSAQQSVTLEGLLSSPFPSEIVAAPVGGHVA